MVQKGRQECKGSSSVDLFGISITIQVCSDFVGDTFAGSFTIDRWKWCERGCNKDEISHSSKHEDRRDTVRRRVFPTFQRLYGSNCRTIHPLDTALSPQVKKVGGIFLNISLATPMLRKRCQIHEHQSNHTNAIRNRLGQPLKFIES